MSSTAGPTKRDVVKSRSVPSTGVSTPVGSPRSSSSRVWRAGQVQDRPVDRLGPRREVGVEAETEGDGALVERLGPRRHRQALPAHVVVDLEQQRERVAGRGMELQPERELVLVPGLERPGQPAHEPVDGVAALGLVQGRLGPHAVELVAAVGQAVGPRGEHLAPARVGPLVGAEAVDDGVLAHRVRPQGGADLADDELLAAVPDAPLLAGGRGDGDPGRAGRHGE